MSRGVTGYPSRQGTRRPTTRSTTRINSAIRGVPGSQHAGNRMIPLIEMDTDSDDED